MQSRQLSCRMPHHQMGGRLNRRELLKATAAAAAAGLLLPQLPSGIVLADSSPDAPVVLTKTDGSTLKGKITQYDRDKVTMDVILPQHQRNALPHLLEENQKSTLPQPV